MLNEENLKLIRMNKNELSEMLLRDGFAKVQYPASLRLAVSNFVKAWKGFVGQSLEHKMQISFLGNGGYENKDPKIDSKLVDFKEDFHINRSYDFPTDFKQTAEDATFLAAGHTLFNEIRPVSHLIAEMLSEVTGVDFVKLAVEKEDGWVIRALWYPPQENNILAAYHPDKSGHTVHLFDSVPGFERFWEGEWKSMSFPETEAVFFPGMLGQYYSECKVKALAHRVVSSPESRSKGRVSIVLFTDYANGLMKYDKDKWGPTQQLLAPGQNYTMPFEEFNKYFTERPSVIDSR